MSSAAPELREWRAARWCKVALRSATRSAALLVAVSSPLSLARQVQVQVELRANYLESERESHRSEDLARSSCRLPPGNLETSPTGRRRPRPGRHKPRRVFLRCNRVLSKTDLDLKVKVGSSLSGPSRRKIGFHSLWLASEHALTSINKTKICAWPFVSDSTFI